MARIDKQAILDRLNFADFYSDYVDLPTRDKKEVLVCCCFHEDKTPSLGINLETGLWNCHACGVKGSVFDFYMKQHGVQFSEAVKLLAERVGLMGATTPPPPIRKTVTPKPEAAPIEPIPEAVIDGYCADLQSKPGLLKYLTDQRGLTAETIEAYRIGFCSNRHRYTLPVKADGQWVNVRMYKPNPGENEHKIESYREGYGTVRLYPSNEIPEDDIVLCEGEWDCLLARQNGIYCYTTTGGAKSFPAAQAQTLKGKSVTILYDIDKEGQDGALNTARIIGPIVKLVRIAKLDITEPPNGDITDYLVTHKRPVDDLRRLIADADSVSTNGHKKPKEFRGLIPPSSFFDIYYGMAADTTDAPPEFHLAAALSAISGAVGNRVWFRAYGDDVFLNLWNVLIAPSGFYRKTTSMRLALRLLEQVCPDNVLPNQFTAEKMLEMLATQPAGVIPVIEFGNLLQMLGRDYNAGLKEMLTELYDATRYRRETKTGKHLIERPAVSIFAGSTIDWVVERCKADDLRSGFFARFLFWPGREKNGWKGLGDASDHSLDGSLCSMLRDMAQLGGPITFDRPLLDTYNRWLYEHEGEVNDHRLPPELIGFYTRISMYVLKFAALYEIGTTERLEVSPQSMDYGIRLGDYLKSHLVQLVQDEMVTSKDGKELKTIKDLIRHEPGISRQMLLRRSKLQATHLTELVDTLSQSGEVVITREATKGRPSFTYQLADD